MTVNLGGKKGKKVHYKQKSAKHRCKMLDMNEMFNIESTITSTLLKRTSFFVTLF